MFLPIGIPRILRGTDLDVYGFSHSDYKHSKQKESLENFFFFFFSWRFHRGSWEKSEEPSSAATYTRYTHFSLHTGADISDDPVCLQQTRPLFLFRRRGVTLFRPTRCVWTREYETKSAPSSPAAQICATSRALRRLPAHPYIAPGLVALFLLSSPFFF